MSANKKLRHIVIDMQICKFRIFGITVVCQAQQIIIGFQFLLSGYTAQGTKMFYPTGSSLMAYSNRMTGLCGICFPGDVTSGTATGTGRNPDRNERTKGSKTPL